ncbi:L-rhamnose mutarotase [Streptomyces prasinus]|uniref:L-rhamnose mutarotase n=1 Tax=Streptomyces prasinus TaxID=67345 RepID=UPI0037D31BB1
MRTAPFPACFDDTRAPDVVVATHPPGAAMRIAPRTRVREDRVARYEPAHRGVPAGLTTAVRAADVTSWTVRRSGRAPFRPLEREDCARLPAEPDHLPVDAARRARTTGLPGVVHDPSGNGAGAGLPGVREP